MWKIKSEREKLMCWMHQPVFACSKSTMEISDQYVKSVQS